jgi:hypothetical protein
LPGLLVSIGFPLPVKRERDRVRGIFEFRPQHLQNALDIVENIVVPNPNNLVSEIAHRPIALGVRVTVRMLPAINLRHEMPLATHKVREIRPNRLLTHEFEARELPIA